MPLCQGVKSLLLVSTVTTVHENQCKEHSKGCPIDFSYTRSVNLSMGIRKEGGSAVRGAVGVQHP